MPDLSSILTPEELLFLRLCRLDFTEAQKTEISELMKVTDWNKFVHLSNDHGIIALCWNNIVGTGNRDNIPSEFLEILHSYYLKSLARNTQIYRLLDEVLDLAAKNNIKVVLLKGLALEKTVYGNRGLRQMNDLDILVREADAMNLRNILMNSGFEPEPTISPLHRMMASYFNHLPAMYKNGLSVEIHFRLFNDNDNSLTSEFLDKSVPSGFSSNNAFIPQPQLHFLYLIKHLAKHEVGGESQLRLYTDLSILLNAFPDEIVNPKLFEYSWIANIDESLYSKLTILKIFWGIEMPDFSDFLTDEINKNEIVFDRFVQFLRQPKDNQVEKIPEHILELVKSIPGIYEKFLFILGHLFPSLTYMKYRYKTKTKVGSLRYYPVRWAKMVRLILSGKE
jgi:hypothetical protein